MLHPINQMDAIYSTNPKPKKSRAVDYTGRNIKGYTVLYPMKHRAKNRLFMWRVQCNHCGHEKTLRSDQLAAQQMPICPCIRAQQKQLKQSKKEESV